MLLQQKKSILIFSLKGQSVPCTATHTSIDKSLKNNQIDE